MGTVFSHIVQKRLSQVNEDVATDTLAFIVNSNGDARGGLIKLLRGIEPGLPAGLQFRTQQVKGSTRPDMCGLDNNILRVLIENKFWAGFTGNQPVEYLTQLAKSTEPTVLLVVAPEARQETVWRELLRRLVAANIVTSDHSPSVGIYRVAATSMGRSALALTSWASLLSAIEVELANAPAARNDLLQLRSLCDAADRYAFVPFSSGELTDQRTPAFVFQLTSIVQKAVDRCIHEKGSEHRGPQAASGLGANRALCRLLESTTALGLVRNSLWPLARARRHTIMARFRAEQWGTCPGGTYFVAAVDRPERAAFCHSGRWHVRGRH